MTNAFASIITAVHLAALGQIESGAHDAAVGRAGEVSRFQIMPAVAAKEIRDRNPAGGRLPAYWQLRPDLAAEVARGIWEKRVATFRLVYRRDPSPVEIYLCWHRPGRVLNPRPRELERATRFADLLQSLGGAAAPPYQHDQKATSHGIGK